MLGAQSMPLMHGMTHLSRGLLAGLQHPHIPSLDASQPYQHQPSLSMHMSQGADVQPYQGLPHPGPYSLAGRPAMVMFLSHSSATSLCLCKYHVSPEQASVTVFMHGGVAVPPTGTHHLTDVSIFKQKRGYHESARCARCVIAAALWKAADDLPGVLQLGVNLLQDSLVGREDQQTPTDARAWDPSGMLSTPQQELPQQSAPGAGPGDA